MNRSSSDIEWSDGRPFMQFDGTNGDVIAETMTHYMGVRIVVNSTVRKANDMLALDQIYPDGQVGYSRWLVPVGHWINVRGGGVKDETGDPVDYADLTE